VQQVYVSDACYIQNFLQILQQAVSLHASPIPLYFNYSIFVVALFLLSPSFALFKWLRRNVNNVASFLFALIEINVGGY
jgi:hypothetical protein